MSAARASLWSVFSGVVLISLPGLARAADLPNPVLFVTQVPVPADFATIGSTFANHMGDIKQVARGGDLWIRYPDGSLRNLTAEAGFGTEGLQGANAIAVRDPSVDFSGTKAVFSMIVGAPTRQYEVGTWYWQLYEITGLGRGENVVITRVPGQPADYNNVQAVYASDGGLIFVGDRPRNGARHLYPQLDEYETTPTPSGLWKLDRGSGALTLLQHSPSGSFQPLIDSFGRVVFTRWDHLQQDQQADLPDTYGTFNWVSESATATTQPSVDVFPEVRADTATAYGHRVNHFFPWTVNQDGSEETTLNHIGRHDLFSYFSKSLKNDPSLVDFNGSGLPLRTNPNVAENWFQLAEDPTVPGRFIGIDAPEFYTHASGQIISITAPPDANASDLSVAYLTPRSTHTFHEGTPPADFTGHYRNPLPLANGGLIAAWTAEARLSGNDGDRANPVPRYKFQLHRLAEDGSGQWRPAPNGALTGGGIVKPVSWWDPDVLVSYDGPLWELSPVEVRARPVPPLRREAPLESPERQAFAAASVDIEQFKAFLAARGLGVIVSRNVTTRDGADRQQPFNLRVPGGVQTTGDNGRIHDITYLQFMQGDQIRGWGGAEHPIAGRRVLAQPLHDAAALELMPPKPAGAPEGSVSIAADGSAAAIVPAQRAMAWQSTDANGVPVVRERYWLSVKPGEVRACTSCHGVNRNDQAGQAPAQNVPQALTELVAHWRDRHNAIFTGGFD